MVAEGVNWLLAQQARGCKTAPQKYFKTYNHKTEINEVCWMIIFIHQIQSDNL